MKLNLKDYKIIKTKTYLKNENFFFLFDSINRNSKNCVNFEQTLKTLNFKYYQVFNRLTNNVFKSSTYKNIRIISGVTFFIKPQLNTHNLIKQRSLIAKLDLQLLTLLSIKLNNKIYTIKNFQKPNSLNYKENKLNLYQLKLLNLKVSFSKQCDLNA